MSKYEETADLLKTVVQGESIKTSAIISTIGALNDENEWAIDKLLTTAGAIHSFCFFIEYLENEFPSAVKKFGLVGIGISAAGVLTNLAQIPDDIKEFGYVRNDTVLDIAENFAALTASAAPLLMGTGPLGAAIAAIGVTAYIGIIFYGNFVADGGDNSIIDGIQGLFTEPEMVQYFIGLNQYFEDKGQEVSESEVLEASSRLILKIMGTDGDDTYQGLDRQEYIYGYEGGDTLHGNGGDDRIYGGDGDDHLSGGTGNDILVGEAGEDTYYYNVGDGNDTVFDMQGANKLVLNGKTITEITRLQSGSNIFEDSDGNRYVWLDTGEMVITLAGSATQEALTLNWFDELQHDFGITVKNAQVPEAPANTNQNYIVGNGEVSVVGGETETIKILWEDREAHTPQSFINEQGIEFDAELATKLWNYANKTTPDGNTLLNGFGFEGSDYNDILVGGYQDKDRLYGRGGDDRIQGLAGGCQYPNSSI